ncbi:hypothetical protein BAUCODRAFT_337272 [Baudoinia panamericana UAMH 10762]|uniref:Uncharacterized protein n=1 Tax=Baudoinia panamericana (strain UAMH 10762) TaxID=717646 RepID=M2NJ77_BAUPA|nr:uncharacterized protein BAUCODRAFT_337272 [Baudoinia panamericana UAMH 10762]EMC99449.1 hypothetical protein BAUCODRAFT_337272 [Baudoinia panamericana UAMH 10762]
MSLTMTEISFPFIVSNGPKVPKEARTTIRKQAMKDVGIARKKRGSYGRVNMRQLPVYENAEASTAQIRAAVLMPSSESPTVDSSQARSRARKSALSGSTHARTASTKPSRTLVLNECDEQSVSPYLADKDVACDVVLRSMAPYPNYERACAKFGLELTSLAILTNFNVGKSTIAMLSSDPSRLASLLGHKKCSYLDYVPAYYGSSECLTAATDCLLARVHTFLAPKEECQAVCNWLYGKALRSLQDALNSDSLAVSADVLCATQLLSLHEVGLSILLLIADTDLQPSFLTPREILPGLTMYKDLRDSCVTGQSHASRRSLSKPCSKRMLAESCRNVCSTTHIAISNSPNGWNSICR